MKSEDLQERCTNLAVRIIRMTDGMPGKYSSEVLRRQIIRSGTSVSANYSAACRSKSRRDFVNKMKVVEEELDETLHWLRLIRILGFFDSDRLEPLIKECNELLSITVKSIVTAKKNGRMKGQTP